ncbi:glycoside hydrolase family 3 protein [Ophiostoma piceae UAMH 11346]|uniref:xylan 1,4-beta-xylosidase n=1 Tax=Ophiostoma piceae (strain UAMH 11346) TaxID=1262450 RepID=S3CPL6_OPHP1|nr:glycoside hydrolase family 3 protein [Ophiostoma piceae UAMH 11346]
MVTIELGQTTTMRLFAAGLLASLCHGAASTLYHDGMHDQQRIGQPMASWAETLKTAGKDVFIESLIANMTIDDLALQLHLMFAGNLVGNHSYYENSPFTSPVGNIHDLYSLNSSHHNGLQRRNLEASRVPIPFLHFGECLHGVGSFKQSLFPQALGLAATFDTNLVYRVGRAIAAEARSIGIHACFSPVLDLAWDARWGRTQEGWGEDKVVTTHMGVAYARGLSKDGRLSDADAVVPVMKHFAAHGAPESGRNTAPFMGHGMREIIQDIMLPFKAVVELGFVRGVMMAYNEIDGIPAAVHPVLYDKLREWNFDGFVVADDTAVRELNTVHRVAATPEDAIGQWFNAGGMIQFYDYSLDVFVAATKSLVASGTVALSTLQDHVRTLLRVKWDLGLFHQPYIAVGTDAGQLTVDHRPLVLEATQKSIVLLKNANKTLPLSRGTTVALLGPFADTLNYGDYSGTWGQVPAHDAVTLKEALSSHIGGEHITTHWGADSWEYTSQNVIPPYVLSTPDGIAGGLRATYYASVDFTAESVELPDPQVPALDWGVFPPPGLPSTNFSVIWEGLLKSPADGAADIHGHVGVAVGPHSVAKLYIDDVLVVVSGSGPSSCSTIRSNILPWSMVDLENSASSNTTIPPGAAPFTFAPKTVYRVCIEFQAYGELVVLGENENALKSQLLFFWNLVDKQNEDAAAIAVVNADVVVLAVGAAWNSDGENGDRHSLGLPPSQERLVDSVLSQSTAPVILVLFGGRPFSIPQHYASSAAVVSAFFPGPVGGQAIADVLVGQVDPGGARLPRTVPHSLGALPARYNYKPSARSAQYVDATRNTSAPCYPFGHGLSYTMFNIQEFRAVSSSPSASSFSLGDTITFSATVTNTGDRAGSFTMQVYLLGRVSTITQPVRQLVAFKRVDLEAGESAVVSAPPLDVDRYLQILDRTNKYVLERGEYVFVLGENGGDFAVEHGRVVMRV